MLTGYWSLWGVYFYLFVYLLIHLFMFSSSEPFGSSVTGVQRAGLGQEACSWIVSWVGQSGVLEPWGVTVSAAPGPLGHLASICDVGVDLILSYFLNLFGLFIQAGSVRLLKAGLHCLYK